MFGHMHSQVFAGLGYTNAPIEWGVVGSGVDQFADSLRQPVIRDGLMEPLPELPGFGTLVNADWARAQIVDDPDGILKMEWPTSEEEPMVGEKRIRWYEQMLEIRLFEEKVQELFMDGLVEGTTHLCQGQEAVPVGAVSAMREDDYMTITYRGHGHALARGIPIEACFAELMGRTTGCCKGVGGSMHFTDVSKGLLGAFAIVGAGLPVAVGAAHSARLQGRDSVALTFFGDGATNIGTFHEALNLASAWKVADDLHHREQPLRRIHPDARDDAARRSRRPRQGLRDSRRRRGWPGRRGGAQRHQRGDRPRARGRRPVSARDEDVPLPGSFESDPARYRPEGELDAWKERDPLTILGERLADEGHLSESDQAALRETTQRTIDEIAERAKTAPFPTLEETRNYVYAV